MWMETTQLGSEASVAVCSACDGYDLANPRAMSSENLSLLLLYF